MAKPVSALEDDQLDRRPVYAQQCVELSRTNARGLSSREMAGLDGVAGLRQRLDYSVQLSGCHP